MPKFLHRNLNGLVGYHLLASDNNKCLRKNAIFWVQDIRKYNIQCSRSFKSFLKSAWYDYYLQACKKH